MQQSLDEYVNLSKDLNPNDINNKDIFDKISSLKKDAANLRVQKVNGVVEQIRQIKESIDYTDPTETKEKLEEIRENGSLEIDDFRIDDVGKIDSYEIN